MEGKRGHSFLAVMGEQNFISLFLSLLSIWKFNSIFSELSVKFDKKSSFSVFAILQPGGSNLELLQKQKDNRLCTRKNYLKKVYWSGKQGHFL